MISRHHLILVKYPYIQYQVIYKLNLFLPKIPFIVLPIKLSTSMWKHWFSSSSFFVTTNTGQGREFNVPLYSGLLTSMSENSSSSFFFTFHWAWQASGIDVIFAVKHWFPSGFSRLFMRITGRSEINQFYKVKTGHILKITARKGIYFVYILIYLSALYSFFVFTNCMHDQSIWPLKTNRVLPQYTKKTLKDISFCYHK